MIPRGFDDEIDIGLENVPGRGRLESAIIQRIDRMKPTPWEVMGGTNPVIGDGWAVPTRQASGSHSF